MKTEINGQTVELLHGDALKTMHSMAEPIFGAVITDPPYSSGGATLTSKQQSASRKYTATKALCPMPDFEGDMMDQRSWMIWMTDVLREARRLSLPGAPLCAFTDWRQLPTLTDAIQRAGWCWRGVAVWDKRNSRPQRGRFRQQAEFLCWASNGHMPADRGVDVLPGVLSYAAPTSSQRFHQTEKPLELMRQIIRISSPDSIILDPFAGSGTTLLAAALEGHDAVGCELSEAIYQTASSRLQAG